MKADLFIITGTSGAGKSTIIPILQQSLSESYRVYDWDEIVRPYDGTGELWANEVTEKMFYITKDNMNKNINTVILGLVKPAWINEHQEHYGINNIKFCLLDISVEERARRLKLRNAPEYLINDLEEHDGLPKWIKESGFPSITIDTTYLTPEEVVAKIEEWIWKK